MKYRDANIRVVLNGFIVKIGCSEVVAESAESLRDLICMYLDDPEKTEQDMVKKTMRAGSDVRVAGGSDVDLGSITTADVPVTWTGSLTGTNIRGESC